MNENEHEHEHEHEIVLAKKDQDYLQAEEFRRLWGWCLRQAGRRWWTASEIAVSFAAECEQRGLRIRPYSARKVAKVLHKRLRLSEAVLGMEIRGGEPCQYRFRPRTTLPPALKQPPYTFQDAGIDHLLYTWIRDNGRTAGEMHTSRELYAALTKHAAGQTVPTPRALSLYLRKNEVAFETWFGMEIIPTTTGAGARRINRYRFGGIQPRT